MFKKLKYSYITNPNTTYMNEVISLHEEGNDFKLYDEMYRQDRAGSEPKCDWSTFRTDLARKAERSGTSQLSHNAGSFSKFKKQAGKSKAPPSPSPGDPAVPASSPDL